MGVHRFCAETGSCRRVHGSDACSAQACTWSWSARTPWTEHQMEHATAFVAQHMTALQLAAKSPCMSRAQAAAVTHGRPVACAVSSSLLS